MNRSLINPIVKKDMLISSRNAKLTVAITLINSLFAIIVAVLFLSNSTSQYQTYYTEVLRLFPILAICESAVISLVMPIITATSVSGERERQTLEIMLTTPVRPVSIVAGKLLSAMLTTLIYVVASLPFLAIAFVFGGLSWATLIKYVGVIIFLDIYIGSFGIFYSCIKKTSVSAAIATIATIAVIAIVTLAANRGLQSAAETYMDNVASQQQASGYMGGMVTCTLFNPVVWIADMFMEMIYNERVFDVGTGYGAYYEFVVMHFRILSVCINMFISAILLFIASKKVMTGGRKKKVIHRRDGIQNGV